MATKNPRINVTFEKATISLLNHLADEEHKSVASIVRELATEALEMREDFYLARLAEKLDKADVKTHKHNDVWK
jgi:predicted DNA-binding protein